MRLSVVGCLFLASCALKSKGLEVTGDDPVVVDSQTVAGRGGLTQAAGMGGHMGPQGGAGAVPDPVDAGAPVDVGTDARPQKLDAAPAAKDVSPPPVDMNMAPDVKPMASLDTDPALVGLWRLDDGEAAVVVRDWSRFGNDAMFLPGDPPTWDEGKAGSALDIASPTQTLIVNESASIESVNTAITVAAWVKPLIGPTGFRAAVSRQSGTGDADLFWLGLSTNSATPNMSEVTFASVDTGVVSTKALVAAAKWSHIAVTYDGKSVRLYLNGKLEQTVNKTGAKLGPSDPTKNDVIVLGGNQNDAIGYPTEVLFGGLDDVRLYARALTAEEVATLSR